MRVFNRNPPKRGSRVIIVGDIHGCYKTFQALLKKCEFDATKDVLVSVGDIINKGPDSKAVVDYFHTRRESENMQVVLGNNEIRLKSPNFYKNNNVPCPHGLTPEEIIYLKRLPECLRYRAFFPNGEDLIIVHAGLVPGITLQKQKKMDVTHMRNVKFDNSTQKWIALNKTNEGVAWISRWMGPGFVVFGHDARRNLQKSEHAIGLDTGCVYGRSLSAAIFVSGKDNTHHEIFEVENCEDAPPNQHQHQNQDKSERAIMTIKCAGADNSCTGGGTNVKSTNWDDIEKIYHQNFYNQIHITMKDDLD